MTLLQAQLGLAGIFVICLSLQMAAVFYAGAKGKIKPNNQTKLLSKLLSVYAVHLAIIIGGIFSQQLDQSQQISAAAFWFALALAVIWNLLLMLRFISFTFSRDDSVTHLLTYITTIASASSFLVAAAIAFFFTKR